MYLEQVKVSEYQIISNMLKNNTPNYQYVDI